MPEISVFLAAVHDFVHDSTMKKDFSQPKIFTGGVDFSQWANLSLEDKSSALKKEWYIYWSYRDPKTKKLKRQSNIKAGANRFNNALERYRHLDIFRKSLEKLLEFGFNPYSDNTELAKLFFPEKFKDATENKTENQEISIAPATNQPIATPKKTKTISKPGREKKKPTVLEAISETLSVKEKTLTPVSFSRYKSQMNKFKRWLKKELGSGYLMEDLGRGDIFEYLNFILSKNSARTRNNAQTDLSSFVSYCADKGYVKSNFVQNISKAKTKPTLHQAYTEEERIRIEKYVAEHDPELLLFIKFIGYAFLRPIEICRLQVKDIDIQRRRIHVNTKTKKGDVKIIPQILLSELPNLDTFEPDSYLFTPEGLGMYTDTKEDNRRDFFSKRFKKVKKHLRLNPKQTLYSFRHTYITMLYNNLKQNQSKEEALSSLQTITGHETREALLKYLRSIKADLPEDYSHLYN